MSEVRLYRLLRDTLYHTSGTILALEPEQVLPHQHELMTLPASQSDSETKSAIEALTTRVAALELAVHGPTMPLDNHHDADPAADTMHLDNHHDDDPATE